MNERIQELAEQATTKISFRLDPTTYKHIDDPEGDFERVEFDKQKFAELIVAEAFRSGMLYSAKKYAAVGDEKFTGNDVAMFLEMEACELSDEDINQHFEIK